MYAANILLDSHPIPPADPGETTTYGLGTPLGLAVTRDLHTKENKYWKVDQNTKPCANRTIPLRVFCQTV
jgi:hypothetical protein